MNEQQIINNVEQTNNGLSLLVKEKENKVLSLTEQIYDAVLMKQTETDIIVNTLNMQLSVYTQRLSINAQYHYLKAAIDPDPGFIAVILGIYNVIKTVVTFIQLIVNSKVFQILLAVHKILSSLWPAYKQATDKVLHKVSEFSKQVAMGVDGLEHILGAVGASSGIIAGLVGGKEGFTDQQWYIKANQTLQNISNLGEYISQDPIHALQSWQTAGGYSDKDQITQWWDDTSKWINDGVAAVQKSVSDISGVTEELQQAISLMPSFIQENIPDWVSKGINDVNNIISNTITPTLNIIKQQVAVVNNVLAQYQQQIRQLQIGLLNPGVSLLRVDDLAAVEKQRQLAMIDDVTSRDFVSQTEQDRAGMSDTINSLDSIVAALTAPTPEPAQYNLETIPGYTPPGITVEPQETWMIGGYNSKY